jgi:hypothetical protein
MLEMLTGDPAAVIRFLLPVCDTQKPNGLFDEDVSNVQSAESFYLRRPLVFVICPSVSRTSSSATKSTL